MGGDRDTWWKVVGNYLGRISNVIYSRVRAKNTIEIIRKEKVPKGRTLTYANFVCDYCPLKSEPCRVILEVGGYRLEYPYDASSPSASLLESKLIFNSTISYAHQYARFISCNLKDSLLENPMSRAEYMRIHSKYFPPDIRDQCQIDGIIAADGYVYKKIIKGTYGRK